MDKTNHRMEQAIKSLRAAAKSIPAAMDEETIQPDEVQALLNMIGDQLELATFSQQATRAA